MSKKIFALVMALCMLVSVFSATAIAAPSYTDTDGHWAEESIDRWSKHGIVEGVDGKFNPDEPLTRGQLAKILVELLNLPVAPNAGFTDVDPNEWYADAINACAAAGIMLGSDGMARPNDTVTREETMVMLGRALGIEPVHSNNHMAWEDGHEVSDWAAPYMNAMINAGIVGGTGNGLEPGADITRASTMTILDRAIAGYAGTDGETINVTGGGIVIVAADNVTITGNVDAVVVVEPESTVVLHDVTVEEINVVVEDATVIVTGESKAESITVTEDAANTTVVVEEDAVVENVTTEAPKTEIQVEGTVSNVQVSENATNANVTGEGTVDKVETKGDNTNVETSGTTVNAGTGTTGTTVGGNTVSGGSTTVTQPEHVCTVVSSVVTAPTCTEDGYTTYTTCCGVSYTGDVVEALGHTEVAVPGKAATCTATGLTDGVKCGVCGEWIIKQEIIDKTEHTGTPCQVCGNGAEAKVGTTYYGSLADAIAVGGNVVLMKSVDVSDIKGIDVTVNTTLNLNGNTLSTNVEYVSGLTGSDISAITVDSGATLNISGGKINAVEYGIYVKNGVANIDNIEIVSHTTAVQIANGTANISGGTYSNTDEDNRYVINCLDADWRNGNAKVNITGGTFVKFNPADNAAEGAGTNFLADGCSATETDGVWTVIQDWADNGDGTYDVYTASSFNEVLNNAKGTNIVIDAHDNNIGALNYGLKTTNVPAGTTVTIKNANVEGRSYGNAVDGTVIFENCTFNRTDGAYSIHFDAGSGSVEFKNCTLSGWCSFGTAIKSVTMTGCTINGNGIYALVRFYQNATLTNCKIDCSNAPQDDDWPDGISAAETSVVTLTGCTITYAEYEVDAVGSKIVVDGTTVKEAVAETVVTE